MTSPFHFEIIYNSRKSSARVGKITTAHGVIDTPNFVAVGTNGTLKALDNQLVEKIGLQLMFCNTYHLLLQPGPEIIQKGGGIHTFINRSLPIITDSGGFQVFSLAYGSVADELKSRGQKKGASTVIKINEEGVLFRSYRDGKEFFLSPESSIAAQKAFGSDIIIPFDELPPYHISKENLLRSVERTHRWEKRSLDAHLKNKNGQAIYGVVHGGADLHLRKESAHFLRQLPFNGFAIGGSMGKNKKEMKDILSATLPHLPKELPNHLLGIADLDSLSLAVPLGIDTFDSSYPTKAARHGMLLTQKEKLNITKKQFSNLYQPIDKNCHCFTCHNYTLAYLHHLFKAKEV
ncbi:MAG: tRNA guanosine(34) transglycosylase Tgt, partial [Simkania negevensis]|nr:tRNA guanosine(34) transglycosylase Tgt [Simkania negevensis]